MMPESSQPLTLITEMVEVFKTNIQDQHQAQQIIDCIMNLFPHYRATVDLGDCDKILRVESPNDKLEPAPIVGIVKRQGFSIDILPDN